MLPQMHNEQAAHRHGPPEHQQHVHPASWDPSFQQRRAELQMRQLAQQGEIEAQMAQHLPEELSPHGWKGDMPSGYPGFPQDQDMHQMQSGARGNSTEQAEGREQERSEGDCVVWPWISEPCCLPRSGGAMSG